MINRQYLATWSLAVDDAGFAQALAALGAWLAASPLVVVGSSDDSAADTAASIARFLVEAGQEEERPPDEDREREQNRGLLAWQPPTADPLDSWPAASLLAAAWSAFVAQTHAGPRLAVRSHAQSWNTLLPMLQTLQHPAVGAASVFVADAFAADGRIDWQLPFQIAVLSDDRLANAFANTPVPRPQPWPYRFGVAGRATPRLEVLVFSGSLRQTAARLLSQRSPSRAALVLILGGLDASGDSYALLRVVAGELAAEGVVCVAPFAAAGELADASSGPALPALQHFAHALSHNTALDIALAQAFGQGITAVLGGDLLHISTLSHSLGTLTARLRALPEDAELAVSEHSLWRLVDDPDRVTATLTRGTRGAAGSVEGGERGQRSERAGDALSSARNVSPHLLARGIDDSSARYGYDHESDEAASLAEIAGELRDREAAAAVDQAELRFIQHSFWRKHAEQLVEERQRLQVGVPIMLRLRIGPPDEQWHSAPAAFPAHELPRSQRPHRLQVVFHEPTQLDAPLLGQLLLPRVGPSTVAEFVFTPRTVAAFEGRVSVLHRGRVLQTVLIHSRVATADEAIDAGNAGEVISQQVEARVREHWGELGSRRRFDASFILNHSNQQRPLLTGIAGKRAWAKDLSGIDEPIASINQLLSEVAHSVADYSDGLTSGDNRKLFIKLARLGADLYSSLVIDNLQPLQSEGMDVDEATHIQLVSTRADAVVPFEFIYQYQPPDDDAAVDFCPNALQALADGACPQACAGQQEPRRHVCPMGFWGLRKVIERHVYNPAIDVPNQAEVIVQAEPVGARVRLQLDQGALVAYSQEVKAGEVAPLLAALRQRLPQAVHVAGNWEEWKQAVSGSHPSLLVAFPHNTGERQDIALEIGGMAFKTLRLPREYVHVEGAYPLLLLLGCDTASSAQHYANHIRYFRQAGAAVIVSTIATVFGPHAVRVGEKLLEVLLAINRQSTADEQSGTARQPDAVPCLGEALRAAKRQALLDSLPMALCVVAFGDADWRL
ncbi:MAG: hypothetical protein DVS81_20080 [Candidatus Accumulibacter meliphilus]|uniref:CHAT domain-containing protein n=1 Tax=Candidatus Accumulibacter meliphilus TaxID=2211374 RepID=A0A369XHH8_9PROT|nr:MAG: hypothetical protein DVS81_20080 [Candidatus Accumulibacter meliphilus]